MKDKQLTVSQAQVLTSGSVIAENVIDLSAIKDIAKGVPMYFVLTFPTAITLTAGTATFAAAIRASATDNTCASSYTTIATTQTYTQAVMTLGRKAIVIPVPPDAIPKGFRYMTLYYTLGATPTTGAVTAHLTNQVEGAIQ